MLWMYEDWDENLDVLTRIEIIVQHTLKIKVKPEYYT